MSLETEVRERIADDAEINGDLDEDIINATVENDHLKIRFKGGAFRMDPTLKIYLFGEDARIFRANYEDSDSWKEIEAVLDIVEDLG